MRYLYKKTKGANYGQKIWSRNSPSQFKIQNGSYWNLIGKVTEKQFQKMGRKDWEKLTNKDRKILREFGYLDRDFGQIERATRKTIYEVYRGSWEKEPYKKITQAKAIKILGRKKYLSGISRSAFHGTASRSNRGKVVYFNSLKLFK